MEKTSKSTKFGFGKIIITLLLCLLCSLSFVGCFSYGGTRGTSSGSSGSGSGSGGSSGGSGGGSGESGDSETPNIDDFNDVFSCAIGVYQINGSEKVFYDKYKNELVSYNDLVERQFDTMATYIYSTLNRIYGVSGSGSSFTISGYGADKTLNYDTLVSNTNQKIITGLSLGVLENKEYLNYANSINGGYKLTTTDNGDGTYTVTYDTTNTLIDNAWKGKSKFSKNDIKKALGYIYMNQQNVANPNEDLTFNSDSILKNYYVDTFNLANTNVINFDFGTINSLGITKEFVWNVAYYVAFSIIGETNINNSINNYNTIFSGSNINKLNSSNISTLPSALEVYKGYNLVIADLMLDIINLNIATNSSLSINNKTSDNTCFPELKKEMYIYYDKIDDLCDANNDDLSADDDFSFNFGDDFDEEEFDKVDAGTAFKLKKILLIPTIDTNKNNISSFTISGLLLGYQSENSGTYKVEMSISGLDKEGKNIDPKKLVVEGGDNIDGTKVEYDETYKMSEDLVDVSIDLGADLNNIVMVDGSDIQTLINDSFKKQTRTVNYSSGGNRSIEYGYLHVYNSLIDGNGKLDVKESLLELNFKYYSNTGSELSEIPSTYLMYFYVY